MYLYLFFLTIILKYLVRDEWNIKWNEYLYLTYTVLCKSIYFHSEICLLTCMDLYISINLCRSNSACWLECEIACSTITLGFQMFIFTQWGRRIAFQNISCQNTRTVVNPVYPLVYEYLYFYILLHSPSFCLEKCELNSLIPFGLKICYSLSYDSVHKLFMFFIFIYGQCNNRSIYSDRIQKQIIILFLYFKSIYQNFSFYRFLIRVYVS